MKNKKVRLIVVIVVILLIIYCAFLLSNSDSKQEKEDEQAKQKITEKYQKIITKAKTSDKEESDSIIQQYQEKFNNPDIIGELSIKNTNLKVPVAQSIDNDYYLNHLLDKTKNSLGSVYLDYRNQTTDRKIIIYGHNSENVYTEFNLLENYTDPSYYNKHSTIYFQTETAKYQYQIFSVYIAIDDFQHVNLNYDNTEYSKHLAWLKSESLYDTGVNITSYDDIIILQTCYYNPQNSYLIIAAKKI